MAGPTFAPGLPLPTWLESGTLCREGLKETGCCIVLLNLSPFLLSCFFSFFRSILPYEDSLRLDPYCLSVLGFLKAFSAGIHVKHVRPIKVVSNFPTVEHVMDGSFFL